MNPRDVAGSMTPPASVMDDPTVPSGSTNLSRVSTGCLRSKPAFGVVSAMGSRTVSAPSVMTIAPDADRRSLRVTSTSARTGTASGVLQHARAALADARVELEYALEAVHDLGQVLDLPSNHISKRHCCPPWR
jgi:hypothetical protein